MVDAINNPNTEDLKQKYLNKLKQEYGKKVTASIHELNEKKVDTHFAVSDSADYQKFKQEMMPPSLSLYEKLCKTFSFIKIEPDPETKSKIEDALIISHLDLTPAEVMSFSINFPLLYMILFITLAIIFSSTIPFFIVGFIVLTSLIMMYFLYNIVFFLSNSWRMKTTNQMILAIFYLVTYMRHTSNLERAVHFASKYITPPLALDFKKMLWDVEVGNYPTIKDSIDNYLRTWQNFNSEFVDAFHLIEASLYEPTDDRRIALLDKSLDVVLEGTFENMLHFSNGLRSPITILHMLGVVMPILGLVILPLVVSFLEGIEWYHIAAIYNVLIPIVVYFFGKNILSNRPSGYGSVDVTDINPELKKLQKFEMKLGSYTFYISPVVISAFIFVFLFLIGISPMIMHFFNPEFSSAIGNVDLISYRCPSGLITCEPSEMIGPFGLVAVLLSFFVVLAIGASIGFYNWYRTRKLIELRNQLQKLDNEFATGLFQLGNRLSDGIPAEVAFGRVALMMPETDTGKLFKRISDNITNLGMSVKAAIFDEKVGALREYPSPLIASSMQVLVEASSKGPKIAANALASIARYVKEIHRVDERLKDVLSDVVSSMESQINFLTPSIAAIVVGLTTMMIFIIGNINTLFSDIGAQSAGGDAGASIGIGADALLKSSGIPSFQFQIIIGLYVAQIIYVLANLLSNLRDGDDVISRENTVGDSLIKSMILYTVLAFVVVLLFNILAAGIISSVTGGAA